MGAEGRAAGSSSDRNRFERRAEILPLPLRSHAPMVTLATEDVKYVVVRSIHTSGAIAVGDTERDALFS